VWLKPESAPALWRLKTHVVLQTLCRTNEDAQHFVLQDAEEAYLRGQT